MRIRSLRQARGWSLDNLAERALMSPSSLSRIENNDTDWPEEVTRRGPGPRTVPAVRRGRREQHAVRLPAPRAGRGPGQDHR
ncbi:helix-turn-helix transcriptional regulator [Nonomuraea sp. NPDC050643]|uniref:helix-turn-helix domain-containing protein n=1 Tax=Nonomuraea sp. NPDC050643 TaxID=3155660 RepID=UPI0033D3FB1D